MLSPACLQVADMPVCGVQITVNHWVSEALMDDARSDPGTLPGSLLRLDGKDSNRWAGIVILAAAYFLAARLGLMLDAVGGFASPVWPPSGIAIATLAVLGPRLWPGVALGAFAANVVAGAPIVVSLGMAVGNTLEALLALALLGGPQGLRRCFDRISDVLRFVALAAAAPPMVSATFGVASGYLGGVIPAASLARAWGSWWLGDFMGILVVSPLLLAWADPPRIRPAAWRIGEAFVLVAAFALLGRLVFGDTSPELAGFLRPSTFFPLLIWAALRFGRLGSVTAVAALSGMAIIKTVQQAGPFARESLNESLLLVQVFLGIAAITMLVFTAGLADRLQTERRLQVNYVAARALAEAPTLEAACPEILRGICENFGWDCGHVWTVDQEAGVLRHRAHWHPPGDRLMLCARSAETVVFHPGVGMAGRIWSEATSIWVRSLRAPSDVVRAASAEELGLRSAMGAPITVGRDVYGVLTFFSRREKDPDGSHQALLSSLGSQIGQFVERRSAEAGLRTAHADLEARIERRTEQLRAANRALEEEIGVRRQTEEALRQLSTRLLRVQDEERQRLARDLHDSTAQVLAALNMKLTVLQRGATRFDRKLRGSLEECAALAELCVRQIRSMSYLLHPPLLEEMGLPAALKWCAEGFTQRSGIVVAVDLPPHFGRLPMEVENALYRIVQECLSNVHRHSGSPTARIALQRTTDGVELEVQDQGRGMPIAVGEGGGGIENLGLGLLGMRERVRQLGGSMTINSTERGSTVRVAIDVPQAEA
jgi:signal transduction histidine kinase